MANNIPYHKLNPKSLEGQYHEYYSNQKKFLKKPTSTQIYSQDLNSQDMIIEAIKTQFYLKNLFIVSENSNGSTKIKHSPRQSVRYQWRQLKKPSQITYQIPRSKITKLATQTTIICSKYYKGVSSKIISFGKYYFNILKSPKPITIIHSKCKPESFKIHGFNNVRRNFSYHFSPIKTLKGVNQFEICAQSGNIQIYNSQISLLNFYLSRTAQLQYAFIEFSFGISDFTDKAYEEFSRIISRWVNLKVLSLKSIFNQKYKVTNQALIDLSLGIQKCEKLQKLSLSFSSGDQIFIDDSLIAISEIFQKCTSIMEFSFFCEGAVNLFTDVGLEAMCSIFQYCEDLKYFCLDLRGVLNSFSDDGLQKIDCIFNSFAKSCISIHILIYSGINTKITGEKLQKMRTFYQKQMEFYIF